MKTLPPLVFKADPHSLAVNEHSNFTRRIPSLPDKQRMRDAKIVAQLVKTGDDEEDYEKVKDMLLQRVGQ